LNTKIESIFHQYYSPLCNYATKVISSSTIAEDIVQDLFVQLWENKKKLDSIENTEYFLLRATKYKCIDYLRTKRINSEIPIEDLPEIIYTENKKINEEDIEPLFYYYTSKLPPKTREIFLLSRKSGLTYKEIANDLNISVKTVENQMSRALRIMRELLKDNELLIFIMGLNFFK
jgi:RNA polymerase sigma-70 factor (ECF subfamily)